MNMLEQTITKRQLFVTVGCQKFPYQRIRDITGKYEKLNYRDLAQLEIDDYAKVVVIQELDLFNDTLKRLLAFKFAEKTFGELKHLLHPLARKEAEGVLEIIRQFINGETTVQAVSAANEIILKQREAIIKQGNINGNKQAIGCLEILLSVSKKSTYSAMREASSIQRDLLGDDWGTWQINLVTTMADNLHDLD